MFHAVLCCLAEVRALQESDTRSNNVPDAYCFTISERIPHWNQMKGRTQKI